MQVISNKLDTSYVKNVCAHLRFLPKHCHATTQVQRDLEYIHALKEAERAAEEEHRMVRLSCCSIHSPKTVLLLSIVQADPGLGIKRVGVVDGCGCGEEKNNYVFSRSVCAMQNTCTTRRRMCLRLPMHVKA